MAGLVLISFWRVSGMLASPPETFAPLAPPALCCRPQVDRSGSVAAFLLTAESLVDPINGFFDQVFVMTDEADVRTNRQALLRWLGLRICQPGMQFAFCVLLCSTSWNSLMTFLSEAKL